MILIDGQKGLRTADSKEYVSAVDSYLDGGPWRSIGSPRYTPPTSFVMYYGCLGGVHCAVYVAFMRRPL